MRRQPGEWMNPVDDRILEFLVTEGASSPKILADGPGNLPENVGDRLRTLTDYGVVGRPGRGTYRITDDGEALLSGELDGGEVETGEVDGGEVETGEVDGGEVETGEVDEEE